LCDSLAPSWVLESPKDYPRLVSSRNLIKIGRNRGESMSTKGSFRFLWMKHDELGGLTTRSQTIWFWAAKTLTWEQPEEWRSLPSMVYLVASDTVEVSRRSKAPVVRILDPVRIQPLGPNLYHGGGLCPMEARMREAKFLLPSVYHQPSGWCIRHLLPLERWTALDVPWRIAKLTREMGVAQECAIYEKLVPGRCLEQGLRTLL
jgi:hypothetical protein